MVTAPQGPEHHQGKPAREIGQFDSLYADLRLLARRQLRRERAGVSWSPTDLVHEAWVRLGGPADACDRVAFLRMAAVVMRNLLTDRARRLIRLRQRYPELVARGEWVSANIGSAAISVVELDDAFRRLAELDERKAQAAVLLGLVGCTQEQAAEALNVSLATLKRDWAFGSAWLRRALAPDTEP